MIIESFDVSTIFGTGIEWPRITQQEILVVLARFFFTEIEK